MKAYWGMSGEQGATPLDPVSTQCGLDFVTSGCHSPDLSNNVFLPGEWAPRISLSTSPEAMYQLQQLKEPKHKEKVSEHNLYKLKV